MLGGPDRAVPLPPAAAPEALRIAGWLLANALLATACWRLSGRLFPRDTAAERGLHCLVLAWAGLVGALLALGSVGLLTAPLALAAVAALAATAHLCLGLRGGAALRPTELPRPSPLWPAVWSALFALAVGHVVVNGLLVFPTDWDTLNYHLPMIDQWLQAQRLFTPACFHWSNPGNHELLGLWAVAPCSGDYCIVLNNLPAVVLLAAATVQMGRELGLSRRFAHLAGAVAVANSVVLHQLLDAENDVAVAALFCAGLLYGLRFLRSRRRPDLLLCSLSVGLLAGVKYYALGYAALAGGGVVALTAAARGPGAALRAAGALAAGTALFAGYWYARNAWVSGSPLYPREFGRPEDTLSRIYPAVATSSFLGNRDPRLPGLAVKAVWRMAGPCHLAALLALPGTLGYLALSGALRRDPGRAGLALLTTGAAALLLITPFAVEDIPGTLNHAEGGYGPARYGLCFLTLAVLALVVTLEGAARALRRVGGAAGHVLAGLLALGCLVQLVFTEPRLPRRWADTALVAGTLLLIAANVVLLCRRRPAARRPVALALAVAAAVGWPLFCTQLAAAWHAGFAGHYDRAFSTGVYSYLSAEAPAGSRICVLEFECYPFFGSARQFRVCQPVYTASAEELTRYLRRYDVAYVAARRPGRASEILRCFRWFDELRARHPDAFALARQDDLLALYRRNCGPGEGAPGAVGATPGRGSSPLAAHAPPAGGTRGRAPP